MLHTKYAHLQKQCIALRCDSQELPLCQSERLLLGSVVFDTFLNDNMLRQKALLGVAQRWYELGQFLASALVSAIV